MTVITTRPPKRLPSGESVVESGRLAPMSDRQRNLALRTGLATAAAISGSTFSRGLLPRSGTDQAMITGAVAAGGLGLGTFGLSAVDATTELIAEARGPNSTWNDPETVTLIAAGAVAAASFATVKVLPNLHQTPFMVATADSLARMLGIGAGAAAVVLGSEKLSRGRFGTRGPLVGMGTAAALGGVAAAVRIRRMRRRAAKLGEPSPLSEIGLPAGVQGWVATTGISVATGAGLLALAGGEYAIAEGSTRLVSRVMGRSDDPVTPLVGHSIAAATVVAAGIVGLNRVSRRVQHADDVREPAYPNPPTSPFVSAGPASLVDFKDIGKEGRRFVLMTLNADQIETIMGEPSQHPIRAVAGFNSAKSTEERAALALRELEALGAYSKSLIVVASPTGVGYVNFSFAEAVEYLTRGDCAILVPQYALVPSALALNKTSAATHLQTLILQGIRDRISTIPAHRRPRLVQFGESLGAQVALDVGAPGTARFTDLGLDGGLYLGTPFRSKLWQAWFTDQAAVDPENLVGRVSQADVIPTLSPSVRHVQVIHDDDPINKFAYDAVLRQPWWMGPPETRPPGVPRETEFTPFVTFVISLVDLKNGMQSRPGQFVRLGHDYRIELCDAVRYSYRLPATDEQAATIETALRNRERRWAARRAWARGVAPVAKKFQRMGVDAKDLGLAPETLGSLTSGDLSHLIPKISGGPA